MTSSRTTMSIYIAARIRVKQAFGKCFEISGEVGGVDDGDGGQDDKGKFGVVPVGIAVGLADDDKNGEVDNNGMNSRCEGNVGRKGDAGGGIVHSDTGDCESECRELQAVAAESLLLKVFAEPQRASFWQLKAVLVLNLDGSKKVFSVLLEWASPCRCYCGSVSYSRTASASPAAVGATGVEAANKATAGSSIASVLIVSCGGEGRAGAVVFAAAVADPIT